MSEDISLVLGADGFIGNTLFNTLQKKGVKLLKTSRRIENISSDCLYLDLKCIPKSLKLPKNISTAYICAGVSKLNECKVKPDISRLINVTNLVHITKKLLNEGCFVVFLSTNQVFDGYLKQELPHTKTNPKTEYGWQKAMAENVLLDLNERIAIVRMSKVVSTQSSLFRKWNVDLKGHKCIYPFSDMVMSPMSINFVVHVLEKISLLKIPKIYHLSANDDISFDKVAMLMAEHYNFDLSLVKPVTAKSVISGIEWIPKHTTLNTEDTAHTLGIKFPNSMQTLVETVLLNEGE